MKVLRLIRSRGRRRGAMLSAVSLRELQLRRENTRSVCENRGAYAGSAAISQSESWPSATDLGAADQDFVRDSGCPTIRKIVPATSTPPITHAMRPSL